MNNNSTNVKTTYINPLVKYIDLPSEPNVPKKYDTFQELLYSINTIRDVFPFLIVFGLVYFTSYQIYLGLLKDDDSAYNITTYVYLILVPVILLFCYIIHNVFDQKAEYSFFAMAGLLAGIALVFYFVFTNIKIDLSAYGLSSYLYLGLIGLVGLMILYNIFEKKLKSFDSTLGFVVNMIFYIPCMLIMLIKYLIQDMYSTSRVTVALFVVQILLIVSYFYIFPIIQKSMVAEGVVLLRNPIMLNKINDSLNAELIKSSADRIVDPKYTENPLQSIQSADSSTVPSTTTTPTSTTTPTPTTTIIPRNIETGSSFRKLYAISMWIYLNPMPSTRIAYTQDSNIFYYGDKRESHQSYHPRVMMTSMNGSYQCVIYCANTVIATTIDVPFQKWNHLVFNYREGGVDIFMNGKLKFTYSYVGGELPTYSIYDKMEVGDELAIKRDVIVADSSTQPVRVNYEIEGLYGAICNVVYYKRPLMKSEIYRNYKLHHYKNPPI